VPLPRGGRERALVRLGERDRSLRRARHRGRRRAAGDDELPAALPAVRDPLGLFGRQKTLLARFVEQETFSLDEIRANASCVAAAAPGGAGFAPGRTLWHALYFPAERRMEVDFYLGEGASAPRRSPVSSFVLGER
jgi:hypothetical protein